MAITCYFSVGGVMGQMHMAPVTHMHRRHHRHHGNTRPASTAERIFGGGFSPLYSDPFFGGSG